MNREAIEQGFARHEVPRLSQAVAGVDDAEPWTRELLSKLYATSSERRAKTHVIGLTGSPGAGKSTVADALTSFYRRQDKRVAIIAVDPSSPFSGGAILGDRIRMRQHTLDEGVFIRSLATRGALGGLSYSAANLLNVLMAADFDVILIETVGVGQDEVDICRVAQSVVVVAAPGMGDDIQAIKAGILEIADVYLVNKADRDGAHKLVSNLKSMLTLLPHPKGLFLPPVLEAVASEGKGIEALAEALSSHWTYLRESEKGQEREHHRLEQAFLQLFRDACSPRGNCCWGRS